MEGGLSLTPLPFRVNLHFVVTQWNQDEPPLKQFHCSSLIIRLFERGRIIKRGRSLLLQDLSPTH